MELVEALLEEAVSMHIAGNLEGAKSAYREILQQQPTQPNANYNLGNIYLEELNTSASLPLFKSALESDPQEPLYWQRYIEALILAANYEEARLVLSYGVNAGLAGNEVDALQLELAQVQPGARMEKQLISLFGLQRYEEVESLTLALLSQFPQWSTGWKVLSDTYMVQGKDAKMPALKALELNMQDPREHCYYGLVLKQQGDLAGAANSFEQAIALKPDYAAAYNNLGIVKKDLGDVDVGVACYRQALQFNPEYSDCYSNMLFCLTHSEHITSEDLFKEHRQFSLQYEKPLRPCWPEHTNLRDITRCLRVGFVSADFREHSIANFFEPVLQLLAQYKSLELHAYYNHAGEDAVTQRFKAAFQKWTVVDSFTDQVLAETIRTDGIDILVDLSGHTSGNRLLTFARKPAPVQVSWLGYLYSTGLDAMDYYLADVHLLPSGQFDHQFTEEIMHLPVNAPFLPHVDAPAVNTLPALKNGYLTFACFNRPNKITHAAVKQWAQLLRALPDSKMLLGAMPSDATHDALLAWFSGEGIQPGRLIFHTRSDMGTYLALHHVVDICLDTFPSNGVTTTCHAAWMGIPTLTLLGDRITSRGAAAVMSHLSLNSVGKQSFVAHDDEDFVKKGLYWASHLTQLAKVRADLRKWFANSALGHPQDVAQALEQAFRLMWRKWCDDASET